MKKCEVIIKFLCLTAFGLLTLVFTSNGQDSLQRYHQNTEFFEIESTKEKIADLIATGKVTFSRQLSSTRFLVQSHKNFRMWQSKKVTDYSWKFLSKDSNLKERTD